MRLGGGTGSGGHTPLHLFWVTNVLSLYFYLLYHLGQDYESGECYGKFHPPGLDGIWFELNKIVCCDFVPVVKSSLIYKSDIRHGAE